MTPDLYTKTCRGCKREFQTPARNARYGPPEVCKCLERRAKQRAKRRKERRQYAKNPEHYRALSRTRAEARKLVLAHFGVIVKGPTILVERKAVVDLGCNSPDCTVTLYRELEKVMARRQKDGTGPRGAFNEAMRNLLKKLEAHHRDHNPFNNYLESYPERSNIILYCRKHHEQADRAKAGKAQLVLRTPPKISWASFLLDLRINNPRKLYTIPVLTLLREWEAYQR